jgi:hypothetical protein
VARSGGTDPAPIQGNSSQIQGNSPQIIIVNNCKFDIWPGIVGIPTVENGGFHLGPSEQKTFSVPNGWQAARIWARTGCDGKMNCDTGFCKVRKQ